MKRKKIIIVLTCLIIFSGLIYSQSFPSVQIKVDPGGNQDGSLVSSLKIVLLLLLLTLAPAIIMMMTSFTRLIISFHFLRIAMGVRTTPPNQVIVGLCLFLTLFIMSPVISQINQTAYQPLLEGKVTEMEALELSIIPLKNFMLIQNSGY